MRIDRLVLGAYQTNCYILRRSQTADDCLIIDTGLNARGLVEFLQQHKLNPVAVVLTHGHADHIAGVVTLHENFPDIKVYIHKLDAEMLTDQKHNLSVLTAGSFSAEPADFLIDAGDVIGLAGIKLEVLHTPGHTIGGICLYSRDEAIVFTDDTLFAGGVGRTDLGGSTTQLIKSIRQELFTLPDDTAVYPGHGPVTTIAQEKANNPFLK